MCADCSAGESLNVGDFLVRARLTIIKPAILCTSALTRTAFSLFTVSSNRCVPPPIAPVLWPLPFGFSQSCPNISKPPTPPPQHVKRQKSSTYFLFSFFLSFFPLLVTNNDESALHLALGCFTHCNYLKTAYNAA